MPYPTNREIAEAASLESFTDREKSIKKLVLQTRIEEAWGFEHGDEAWSGNMNDDEVQSNNPVGNYQNRLRKEIEEL